MNTQLRDRILRKLDSLADERGYQLLDYVEFLESKYAAATSQAPNVFERFAEGVEDTLRAGRVSASTIAETMGLLNRAMSVLSGVAAAGKSVASDVVDAASRLTMERPLPPEDRSSAQPERGSPPASRGSEEGTTRPSPSTPASDGQT